MPDEIALRHAGAADAEALAVVLARAFASYAPRYTPEALAATTPPPAVLRARLAEGPVWIAERGAEILGTVGAVLSESGVYVRSMAVVPEAAGQGLGRKLLAAVEDFATEAGAARLFLSTTPFLDRAIRLYERAGFRRTAAGPHDLHGTPIFTMEKWLGNV